MKRILIAVAALPLLGGMALADESTYDTVVRKFGEAYAIGEKCPTLEVNAAWTSLYALGLGIEFDDAFKLRLAAEVNKARATIASVKPDMACVMGNMLYGKKGTNGPNLLMNE